MPKKKTAASATGKKKIRILLVEDDSFLAGMYVTKLTLEGFQVTLASDGEQGIESFKKEQPEIILLDIVLPKMSGFDVLKAIKQDPKAKQTRVILLTNLGQREDVSRGLALGADDYLIKAHFMPSEVVEKIKKIING